MLYFPALRSPRLLPLAIAVPLLALPLLRVVQDGGALWSLAGMVVGVLAVGIAPGLLLGIVTGALGGRSMIEAAAIGFGVSFAVVQALTVGAIVWHVSASNMIAGLWAMSLLIALVLVIFPQPQRMPAPLRSSEWLIVGLAAILACALYMQSPWEPWLNGEDAVHVAVTQRLAFEPAPALDTIYWAPNFTYTYPFPGTHYFMALVSRAAKLDPLFVYMKIRMFWSPMALFMLYAGARLVFGSDRVGLASALVAGLLILTGPFGPIAQTWGQLAPVSHAADIAMTVLLPTLLLFAMNFAVATTVRTAALFVFGTFALVLTLTVVHIREVVQFLVYVGSGWAIFALVRRDRKVAARFAIMTIGTIALVVVYLKWHQFAVGHVDAIVAQRREILIQAVTAMKPAEFLTPIFANPYFNVNQQYYFYMWFPIIILAAPLVLMAYRDAPLVPFVTASLLGYAVVLFVPAVAIAFVYLTYFEILFTPVRNWLFFIYMLAGPLLLLLADAIGRASTRTRQVSYSLIAVLVLFDLYRAFEKAFVDWQRPWLQNVFFLILIAGCVLATLSNVGLKRVRAKLAAIPAADWQPGAILAMSILLVGVVVTGWSWKNSPLSFDRAASKWTFRAHLAWMADGRSNAFSEFDDPLSGAKISLSEKERIMAAPSAELIAYGRQLPSNAVFVHNILNRYASPVFMPQRILMWPMEDAGGLEFNSRLFPTAWSALVRTAQKHQVQPFFNDKESLEERLAYAREVGATHILLDPMYYARLRSYLSQWPDRFVPGYDDGSRWAVFEIKF
jgi:hypothetical protein